MILVSARRFRCLNDACVRKTFASDPGRMPLAMLAASSDRNPLAADFQRAEKLAGVPPGSIVRPRQ
jgi:hypothetical protein